jgi:hypothetical protein
MPMIEMSCTSAEKKPGASAFSRSGPRVFPSWRGTIRAFFLTGADITNLLFRGEGKSFLPNASASGLLETDL